MKNTRIVAMMTVFIFLVCMGISLYAQTSLTSGNESIQELIKKAKATTNPKERSAILSKMSNTMPTTEGEVEQLLDLIDTIENSDSININAVGHALKNADNPSFAPLFYKRLKNGGVKSKIVSAVKMRTFKYVEAVPDLIEIVKAYDPQNKKQKPFEYVLQVETIDSLAEIGDERAIPVLLSTLGKMHDMEPVRIAKLGKKVLPQLIEIMNTSKDADVKRAAGHAIGLMTDKELIPEFWKRVQTDLAKSGPFRSALLSMTDHTTTPTKEEVEDFIFKSASEHPNLKSDAIIIARKRGNAEYLISIVKDKKNEYGDRELAINFLGDLKVQSAIPVLLEIYKKGDRGIGSAAADALTKITGQKYEWENK